MITLCGRKQYNPPLVIYDENTSTNRNAYRILVGNPEGVRPPGRYRRRGG
jgi:hypothetical protein